MTEEDLRYWKYDDCGRRDNGVGSASCGVVAQFSRQLVNCPQATSTRTDDAIAMRNGFVGLRR